LVPHARNCRGGGERPCIQEAIQQELQTQEMVAMCMRDVNRRKILTAPGDPIDEFLRMLRGPERIYKDGIAFCFWYLQLRARRSS
jgi:hypothetical protein